MLARSFELIIPTKQPYPAIYLLLGRTAVGKFNEYYEPPPREWVLFLVCRREFSTAGFDFLALTEDGIFAGLVFWKLLARMISVIKNFIRAFSFNWCFYFLAMWEKNWYFKGLVIWRLFERLGTELKVERKRNRTILTGTSGVIKLRMRYMVSLWREQAILCLKHEHGDCIT